MRPKSQVLRYAFRAAKAKLEKEDRNITISTLAVEIDANFKTVQRFLYRDHDLAEELGVELEHVKHGLGEYADAIVAIPPDKRPTVRRLAELLGLDHSSVARFLKAHPELRALHPRFDPVVQEPVASEQEIKPESLCFTGLRWRDLGISVWHEKTGRYVGVSATRSEYLEYWSRGLLKHQCEKQPKPEHLPTPEEVKFMT